MNFVADNIFLLHYKVESYTSRSMVFSLESSNEFINYLKSLNN